MTDKHLAKGRNKTATRRAPAQAGVEVHSVARYHLRLVKENEDSVWEPETLSRPSEIAAFLWKRAFDGLDREVMCAVYLDVSRRVIGWTVAYVGCLSRCAVEPRGLVVPALLANASGLVIAHNHPSGKPEPSDHDKLFTRQMQYACDVLRLTLVDSLVIAEGPAGPLWTSILSTMNG